MADLATHNAPMKVSMLGAKDASAFQALRLRGLQVNLCVNAQSAPAIALYEDAGFKRFGLEHGFMLVDGTLQDELHMVCINEQT